VTGSAIAVICTSFNFRSASAFCLPLPPAPTIPTVILSLGARNPFPPSTCRGTIIDPAAATAIPFTDSLRVYVFCLTLFLLIELYLLPNLRKNKTYRNLVALYRSPAQCLPKRLRLSFMAFMIWTREVTAILFNTFANGPKRRSTAPYGWLRTHKRSEK